ncbi:DUF3515 family protein [Aestuariimicrobium sp. T2.26MG-19.2B]|uniref:DUF3515 family protein n=1 Tax=Aestuariimicrobium sp. T2.26MG-19.2B TaxID=3040679 RepID=UPI002477B310|nr:DUF3515 family protein [Aestuariimicrobium sp. T2.26MG-19.2B]CAI9408379.1 hypothetical protein AESSP_02019 [Aestuariimicrobium sp. T2.26MG-19.2B]
MRTARSAIPGVLACLTLAACGAQEPPSATSHTPPPAAMAACQRVLADLPETVAGLQGAVDARGRVAYWGSDEKRVVLRCGVDKPAGLEPGSRCDMVNGVGWWAEKLEGGYRFTTLGRAAFVQVEVPPAHAPEADVLNELSGAVGQDPVVTPCV